VTPETSRDHVLLLQRTLLRLTGRDLLDGLDRDDPADAVFHAPYALLSHDGAADPVFTYGNAAALAIFERDWDDFTRLPSRLSAEPDDRAERARLLERVTRDGYVSDYTGIRVSSSGRRFLILDATVWNLVEDDGRYVGQAALIEKIAGIQDAGEADDV